MERFHILLDHGQRRGVLMSLSGCTPVSGRTSCRGTTLIELMAGIAILAVMLAMGAPMFAEWITNTRVRTTAETLQSGLQMARAEAVRRNAPVRFQFVTAVDNSCALSTSGPYWAINVGSAVSPAGGCGNKISDTVSPFLVQLAPAGSSAKNVVVEAVGSPVIGFNGLGRQIAIGGAGPQAVTIGVSSSSGSCVRAGGTGTVRCLSIVVSTAGDSRLCDPARQTTGDPMKC